MTEEESTAARFLSSRFDYVIVGGGTAGLTLAARLSEDADIQVGVLEAGKSRVGDANVESPSGVSKMLHNPEYDWTLESTPQAGTNGRKHNLSAGKMLGGSSGINFMTYCRPAADDIDLWGQLGNEGWSWSELAPYYRRAQMEENSHCKDNLGSIKTSLPRWDVPVEQAMINALNATAGTKRPSNPWSGNHLGFYEALSTLDFSTTSNNREEQQPTRSYATSGYLMPNRHRSNLQVLDEATVCRVILANRHDRGPYAHGVEFRRDGVLHQVFAKKEIILCAGTLHSPQLLELSGIGNRDVLNSVDIPCQVALPDVGKNLREHPMASVSYHLQTPEDILPPKSAGLDNDPSAMACAISIAGFVPFSRLVSPDNLKQTIANASPTTADLRSHSARVNSHIVNRLPDPKHAAVQLIGYPSGFDLASENPSRSTYSLIVIACHPLSHGSCHIQSRDPFAAPRVDLGILSQSSDVDVLAAGVALADRVFHSEHLVGRIAERASPAPSVDLRDSEQAASFVRETTVAFNHGVGTCSMGCVVDHQLRVNGVGGLRVVDASVIPAHIDGNPVSTVYALAERASDLIKQDRRGILKGRL